MIVGYNRSSLEYDERKLGRGKEEVFYCFMQL